MDIWSLKNKNMCNKLYFTIICLVVSLASYSQISFKTEYLGASPYWHETSPETRDKVNDCTGSAKVMQANIMLPLLMKMNTDSMPTICALATTGSYTQLNNNNFTEDMVSKIMNLQLGIIYIKPINKKWSILSAIGAGIYAPFTDFSKLKYENFLGNIGLIFIRHLKPNLKLGGGLVMNNTFGYPMLFPAIYFDWNFDRDFALNISTLTGLKIKAGYKFNKHYRLNWVAEINAQLALLEKINKKTMFTHQYMVTGISPELTLGKHLSISITGGINLARPAYFNDRSLKGFFNSDAGYYFGFSPYGSVSIIFR